MRDDFGNEIRPVETVPALTTLLAQLMDDDSPFEVLEDFHPAFDGSITLVHRESGSALTFVVVETTDRQR